ncbi:GyrI-like domain-containing protein [Streptomyces sp. NPDC004134]|uniref:GyrI-like domain-containing protein n=1 Tax=Streptomyces sp. NPDC004134 TaxID=3364691 RepID=UPI0036C19652
MPTSDSPSESRSDSPSDGKYDVKRALRPFYAPRNTDWELVDVPAQRFLAVDGAGDPNTTADYARAVEALYAVAYTVKFASKRTLGRDFVVGPLEGLWWADRPEAFVARDKGAWQWRMLISLPEWITDGFVGEAKEAKRAALAKKGAPAPPALPLLRVESLREGTSAQLLHVGPYDDEGPALARLHDEYLAANGLRMTGHHHEVYLSDPRRARPEKLKTVLRQPVERAE